MAQKFNRAISVKINEDHLHESKKSLFIQGLLQQGSQSSPFVWQRLKCRQRSGKLHSRHWAAPAGLRGLGLSSKTERRSPAGATEGDISGLMDGEFTRLEAKALEQQSTCTVDEGRTRWQSLLGGGIQGPREERLQLQEAEVRLVC